MSVVRTVSRKSLDARDPGCLGAENRYAVLQEAVMSGESFMGRVNVFAKRGRRIGARFSRAIVVAGLRNVLLRFIQTSLRVKRAFRESASGAAVLFLGLVMAGSAASAQTVDCFRCPCDETTTFADEVAKVEAHELNCRTRCDMALVKESIPGRSPMEDMRSAWSYPSEYTAHGGFGCFSVFDDVDPYMNSFGAAINAKAVVYARDVDWAWGNRDGIATVDEFEKFFASHGFRRSENCDARSGWRKLALFEKQGDFRRGMSGRVVTHVAVSSSVPGWWKSKLGLLSTLIHRLSGMDGWDFGRLALCMEKKEET